MYRFARDNFKQLSENRLLPVMVYVMAGVCLLVTLLDKPETVFEPSALRALLAVFIAVAAFFVFCISFFGLVTYLVFLPSFSRDSHLFNRVHSTQMLHPLTTSVALFLLSLCLFMGSFWGWLAWSITFGLYLLHTGLILWSVSQEHQASDSAVDDGFFLLLLNLVFGAEIVTLAGGAKPLAPWQLKDLPLDTWIVDVRTKPEFHWNRMQGAENFPWGAGVVEAAATKPRNRPVLVTCLSGHRSPAVAVFLRKLGFKTVYNLHWGIIYLMILERGKKGHGPFSLTRPHRDPHRRGEDLRHISISYVLLQLCILVIAPLEYSIRMPQVSGLQQTVAVLIGIGGLTLGWLSFRALGKNFRVYAAPRRSGTLVTKGVYAKIRHPMYTAATTMFAGYWLFFDSLFSIPLWLAFTVLYVVKSIREERILSDHYSDYDAYVSRTWRFIPYVW
jgi:protein-S-isoprenylcysteine O-methyltransferase Ste14/rhodanese-related sulfurtransferase